ncbi:MAG: DNA alkylation repair protein [Micromonosporaceae bacterium]
MSTPLTDAVMQRLREVYVAAADPARGTEMRRYMRDQFDFLGIPSPRRRALSRAALADLDTPAPADLRGISAACWTLPEREYQYFAVDLLVRHAKRLPHDLLPDIEHLITARSWWDTVDPLATRVVGDLVRRHRDLAPVMDGWIGDDNVWLARTALLHQLHYREATDSVRLFRYCRAQAGHPDFFVRKAIGWALRQYARTDPGAVRHFVLDHREQLSPLSVREATRHVPKV